MKLIYPCQKTEQQIYDSIPSIDFIKETAASCNNILIKSDNLQALKWLIEKRGLEGKVDLVYIDPPFATGGSFTITEDRSQTISNTNEGDLAYDDKLKGEFFIEFIRERLVLLKRLLSSEGSIYLHIDYKIGHYVKLAMDDVFGIENFRNDITRIKCNPKNFARRGYSNLKDMILFYSKGDKPIWNEPNIPYSDEDIAKLYPKTDKDGRHYTTVPLHAPGETKKGNSSKLFKGMPPPVGRHWRTDIEIMEQWDKDGLIEWSSKGNPRKINYVDEQQGKRVQDVWMEFKDPQYPVYPTEKNPDMLDLIVRTSSKEGSIVLDCFAGSGTTLKAAQDNNRNWIGIDQSEHAIKAILKKLDKAEPSLFAVNNDYEYYTAKL